MIGNGREYYDTPAASLMLAGFNHDDFVMIPPVSSTRMLSESLPGLQRFATSFGVIRGDPYNSDTQDIIHALQAGIDNCFLVGGGTHPGSGLPTIYESARISANLLCRARHVAFEPPGGLETKQVTG